MINNNLACVLSIAGTDPSGGAGISADIKAISATGGYAAAVITALVAQNTQGVQCIERVSPEFVHKQLNSVFLDLPISAVKIGMLHDERIIAVVSKTLDKTRPPNIVFDPVMVAKDGSLLLELDSISLLKEKLLPLTDLITPNLFEAEYLIGGGIRNFQEMEAAALAIGQQFRINVLIKGGHLETNESSDVLFNFTKNTIDWFSSPRVKSSNTHGTGCTLSSAISSYLAQGLALYDAVASAKNYISHAIQSGKNYRLGKGNGPVDHFYFLENRTREC
ncbi:bifunctional hydroxymethylpyrimidine kinase/phosphomethylpyrimidine kinase [Legionella waltersii]|uniref:hydroxymethylpyrimidine kinase n=1 Tax=Legionella waltersii TaxID=66969 RepID=A0A0W1A5I2_9GAMM|nr:bifunctional hydroxymethylpyrimidine kinase/phosphomethylpyrimidine kinase [Legionella waltersii]KTD76597.1 bifunctional hydroxy-methylpyrimidine kinase and hydroxy-phosphomethylpyrimidine kinase [Legionella waltersii]SNU94547.1 bifunctional hydroxy-methylpyrimidine kinase and hydroxy-phosphomethylpyrimidine kinase [Legionella waltersii]